MGKVEDLYGKWTPYFGYRYKEFYDIMLEDGTIFKSMYPNSYYWGMMDGYSKEDLLAFKSHKLVDSNGLHDKYVVAIRLLTDEEIINRDIIHFTGKERVSRLNYHFPYGLNYKVIPESKLIKPHELREFVNKIRDIALERRDSQSLRESLVIPIRDLLKPFIKE